MRIKGNDYNLMEIAGAFGDLGTLIPFVAGYITLSRMDPLGILVSMGALMIMAGLYYRTPIPVQPMKAIGAAAIAGGASVTHGMIWGAGLLTGAFWLIMGLFFSDSVSLIFKVFPPSILGVILFFAGVQLALAVKDIKLKRQNLAVLVITAGISMWNMGVAYITGLALYYMVRKKWIEF